MTTARLCPLSSPPEVEQALSDGAIRRNEYFQSVTADGGTGITQMAAEFRDQADGAECLVVLKRAHINVKVADLRPIAIASVPRPIAREVKDGGPGFFVVEIRWTLFIAYCVDGWAEIYWRSPAGIVTSVMAPRNPYVVAAITSGAVACEKE